MNYGYEYFCGANVLIEMDDVAILECAGLSYRITEDKLPLYGYSSRHFDAVARGRVIVQGSILVNYVDQDYLWHSQNLGVSQLPNSLIPVPTQAADRQKLFRDSITTYGESAKVAAAFKSEYWDRSDAPNLTKKPYTFNMHDLSGAVDIRVTFGDRNETSDLYGSTGYLLRSVYFTGRSQSIQIDEQVIVEEISFIARNVEGLTRQHTNLQEESE